MADETKRWRGAAACAVVAPGAGGSLAALTVVASARLRQDGVRLEAVPDLVAAVELTETQRAYITT